MRFVCKFATGSGDEVCERKAAAAAAEDSDPVDGAERRKAEPAAAAAAAVVLRSTDAIELAREERRPKTMVVRWCRSPRTLARYMCSRGACSCECDNSGDQKQRRKSDITRK